MKNRATLLALIVLAIATLLMLFVVLPQLSGDMNSLQKAADKATETVKQAAEKAAETAPQAVAQLKEKATATLEKMDRIGGGANEAVASLSALFDKGRMPTAEEFAAARQKAETALTDLAAIELPEGIGGDLRANAQKMRDDAVKAIEWLKSLPADPATAAAVIGKVKELFPVAFQSAPDAPKTDAAKTPSAAAPVSALPSFDVLRVEPDGSTVIAGRAAPGVTIEIVSGETVLTKAMTGPGGEFAAILDNPLPPGDHQLALRAAGADGSVTLSGEVATVSVPKDKDGQLLAMISTPGQASRLLTIPAAQGSEPAKPADVAATAPANSAGASAPAAATPTTGAAPEVMPATPVIAPVRVSAVEIENDRIFVAGSAKIGATIRAFAGNSRIGEVTVDPSGHFVVDGTVPLAPGDHLIVVEMLDEKGNVAMKVSVPFNRPAGNQVSAIAGDVAPADAVETPDTKALATLRANVSKAYALLKSLFADGKVPGNEELAAARSATEFALKALGDFVPDVGASDAIKTQGADAAAAADKALAALVALPKDAAGLARAIDHLADVMNAAIAPTAGLPAPSADPTALSQAPLTPSDNAVIIRRGDTLWQISRRVYGQGVRYTTIYLANRGEINNPDLIEPGQVFTVPKDALPNAEELHRKRLSGKPLQ